METWKQDVNKLIHLAWYSAHLNVNRKFAYNMVDKALRSASDILSAECDNVVNNTMSVIQWCRLWSDEALHRYWLVKEQLTDQRAGKPPTHRQICQARDERGKRWWTVEHEYPILIPKKGVLDDGWSEVDLRIWMWEFGRATIITQEENARLINHTDDMSVAKVRYSSAKILVCTHPHFEQGAVE
jgi:hypothetical protein